MLEPSNGPNLSASPEKSARKTAVGQMVTQSKFPAYAFFSCANHLYTLGDREAVAVIGVWGTAVISLMDTSTLITAKRISMTT